MPKNESDGLLDVMLILFLARAVISAVAALTMFLGSIFAIIAVVIWDQYGDPDASNSV